MPNRCYFDVFNAKIVGQGSLRLTKQLLEVASKLADGGVNLTGRLSRDSGVGHKHQETGPA